MSKTQKLPKPSKERLERLKAMKRKPTSSPSSNPVLLPAPKQHRTINLPEQFHWNQTKTEVVTTKRGKRTGVKIVNTELDNYVRKRTPTFTLCEFVVQYNHLSGDGNLGKQIGTNDDGTPKLVTNPKEARFSVQLAQGCPEKCEKIPLYKNLATKQENCMQWARSQATEMMRHAFADDEVFVELKQHLGKITESEFLKRAMYSFDKADHGEDDEPVPIMKLTRKITDWDGNKDPPRFWKMTTEGTFEIFHPKYIPRGTFVIPTATFRAYGFVKNNGGDALWGVSMDLGKDIIVVSMGEEKSDEEKDAEAVERRQNGLAQALSEVPCLF